MPRCAVPTAVCNRVGLLCSEDDDHREQEREHRGRDRSRDAEEGPAHDIVVAAAVVTAGVEMRCHTRDYCIARADEVRMRDVEPRPCVAG